MNHSQKHRKFLEDYINIADIHAARLTIACNKAKTYAPLTATFFENIKDEQLAYLDMLTTRLGKLQDIIGTKIFTLVLYVLGENIPSATFIDKVNKLEKLEFIQDANWWIELRLVRNNITHDYPDDYDLLSRHFNEYVIRAQQLLEAWSNIKSKIEKLYSLG